MFLEGDGREVVPTSGIETLRRKTYRSTTDEGGTKITAFAHRDTNNHVVLLLSNLERKNKWEIVLDRHQDLSWYRPTDLADNEGLRDEKWYKWISNKDELHGNEFRLAVNQLAATKVEPMTTENNHPMWFFFRSYSCTSTQTDAFIRILKSMPRPCLLDSEMVDMDAFDNVMKYLRDCHFLQANEDIDLVDEGVVEQEVEEMMRDDENSSEIRNALIQRVEDGGVEVRELRAYLSAIRQEVTPSRTPTKKMESDLLAFCREDDPVVPRYMLLSKAHLVEVVIELGIASPKEVRDKKSTDSQKKLLQRIEDYAAEDDTEMPPLPSDVRVTGLEPATFG